jgi:hypothetical protein
MPLLSPKAEALILEHEVGGGQAYYNKKLIHPTWPGGASGVTIGVGYDLGYNTSAQFTADWGSRLDKGAAERLAKCLGSKGTAAKALIPGVKDIAVPWAAASAVFFARTVPRFYKQAQGAFPGMERLPLDAQGALVSLVFNRGTSMKGKSRVEMRAIRDLVPKGDLKGIAAELRKMKRLWMGKGLDGLIRRREDEAKLVEGAAGQTQQAQQALTQQGPAAQTQAAIDPQKLATGP